MNNKFFELNISTPEAAVYDGKISSLIAPGELGYLGILVDHAPLTTNLVPGKIIIKEGSYEEKIFHCKSRGIMEVFHNHVSILVDSMEKV